jgi:antitoxin ParD1/3/4
LPKRLARPHKHDEHLLCPRGSIVDQVAGRGFGTNSEYVRAPIRIDQDHQRLRSLLLEGALSPSMAPADGPDLDGERECERGHKAG